LDEGSVAFFHKRPRRLELRQRGGKLRFRGCELLGGAGCCRHGSVAQTREGLALGFGVIGAIGMLRRFAQSGLALRRELSVGRQEPSLQDRHLGKKKGGVLRAKHRSKRNL
jgi:hypothetical protein